MSSDHESGSEVPEASGSEELASQMQVATRSKRRSKHDPYERSYMCGCGKTYLSYPALYTHVKNKHDGQQPEGTVMPESSKHKGRGRPRKISTTECVESAETFDSLQNLGYFGGPANPLHGVDTDPSTELYDEIARKSTNGAASTGLWGDVLAEYLVDISHFLSQEQYRCFLAFVQLLHRFLNAEGWMLPHAPERKGQTSFCKSGKTTALPQTFEQFHLWRKRQGAEGRAHSEIAAHLQRWLYAWGYIDLPLEAIQDKQTFCCLGAI